MKKKNTGPATVMYHFCAARDVRAIQAEGLTKGMTPAIKDGGVGIIHGTQWLTTDKDPTRQSWNTHSLVKYSRTAYRLTISIPHSHRKKLVKAADFLKLIPETEKMGLLDWPGSENWHIYIGKIPPAWIVGVQRMEAQP